jgi:hypothetical protein
MRLLFLLLAVSTSLQGQVFKIKIYAEKGTERDSVMVGYDPTATMGLDAQFGEQNIFATPFAANFEMRAGQIDLNGIECDENNLLFFNNLILHQTKVDIVRRTCTSFFPGTTINGLAPYSTLFLKNSDIPLVLRWDASLFNTTCLRESFITDWHPGGWFDASCPNLSIGRTLLFSQDSVLITKPSGIYVISPQNDTLSMFHIALGDRLVSTEDLSTVAIEISPNPTTGIIHINGRQSTPIGVRVYDSLGKLILATANTPEIDLTAQPDGVYFVRIQGEQKEEVHKIIKKR